MLMSFCFMCVYFRVFGWKGGKMSLYDDLGVATSDTKTEGWSKNFKLLQSQLKVKKAALTQAKVGQCLGYVMPDNDNAVHRSLLQIHMFITKECEYIVPIVM